MYKHDYPGRLIIVEGIDGSGKSTQLQLLYKYLAARNYTVSLSEWNSSPLVKSTTSLGKKKKFLTPTTFSLIHATDFADRLVNHIIPLLKAGVVVLADRYAFTAFARDTARGVHPQWVRNLYSFAPMPDIAFYFRVPLDVSIDRILTGRTKLKYYEAGMDLGLSRDPEESFKLFQERILRAYDDMIEEFGFTVMDGTLPIEEQQEKMRAIVDRALEGFNGLRRPVREAVAR
jgi:dTMP kinase